MEHNLRMHIAMIKLLSEQFLQTIRFKETDGILDETKTACTIIDLYT